MQIIQELRAGTVHFQAQPDGSESFTTKPPTSLNLRASRVIEELVQALQGLERSNQTLADQLQQTEQELNAQRNLVQKLLADAEQLRAGTVSANTETAPAQGTPGMEKEAGPTHGSA